MSEAVQSVGTATMGNATLPTPDQQAWLKKVNQLIGGPSVTNGSNGSTVDAAFAEPASASKSSQPLNLGFPPRPASPITGPNPLYDPIKMQEFLRQEQEKREKSA